MNNPFILLFFLCVLIIPTCKEKSSKSIAEIDIPNPVLPANIDEETLKHAEIIHKYLKVELNDSLEGEILEIFTQAKAKGAFNSLSDYLRMNKMENLTLLETMFNQWDQNDGGHHGPPANKYHRQSFLNAYSKNTRSFDLTYENARAYHYAVRSLWGIQGDQLKSVNLSIYIAHYVEQGLDVQSDGVIKFWKEAWPTDTGKRDDQMRYKRFRMMLQAYERATDDTR